MFQNRVVGRWGNGRWNYFSFGLGLPASLAKNRRARHEPVSAASPTG